MNTLYTLTSIFFFIWIIRNTFFWVSLWQTKEYRIDRLVAHLTETIQGRTLLLSPLNFLKWIGILSYPVVIFNEQIFPLFAIAVCCLYAYECARVLESIITHRFKRPVFTIKALLLVVVTLGSLSVLFILGIIQQGFLWLLILDKLTVLFITFFVLALAMPTMLYQDYKIDLAIKRIKKHPKILVIGVTGSYGKSSTKEYIAQILAKQFTVVKTKGTNNTPIGLANTILRSITDKTEIFVAEMGAYKRGEISQLCHIASPKIGVLTAVSLQHASLFGSPENLAKAKYELIEALPSDGIGLFNVNNQGAYVLYKKNT